MKGTSSVFHEVIDGLSYDPEVKTVPVACANIQCVTVWNMRYRTVTHSRLSWLLAHWRAADGKDDCYFSALFTEAFLFFGGVWGCGVPVRQLELTVPCARAQMWAAWHFKSLRDAWHFKISQASPGGSRGWMESGAAGDNWSLPGSPTPPALSGTGVLKTTLCLGHCQ